MRLQIASPHMTLDPVLRAYVQRRMSHLIRHFDRDSCDLHVVLERPIGASKHRSLECSMRLTVPGNFLVARKPGHDAYLAVDAAVRALERELEDWKQRVLIGTRWPKKYYVARRVEWNTHLPGFAEPGPPEERLAAPEPSESEEGVRRSEEEYGPRATYIEL